MNARNTIRNARGVTLVEMLVAMVVMGIIGVLAVNIFRVQHHAQARQNTGVERTMNARAAVDMMAREMRNAGYDPYGTGKAGFEKMNSSDVKWSADLNGDGDTDDFGNGMDETVRYFHDAEEQTIVREVDDVQSVVADNVSNLAFVYLDGDMKATGSKQKVQQVNIAVTYPTPDGVMDGSMQTQVALRNTIWGGSSGGSGGGADGSATCDPGEKKCDWDGDGLVETDTDKDVAEFCKDAEKEQEDGIKKRDDGKEDEAKQKFAESTDYCDQAQDDHGVTCPVCGDPDLGGWTDDYEDSVGPCSLGDETCDWNEDSSVNKDDEKSAKLCVEAREHQLKGLEKEEKGDDEDAEKEYGKSQEKCDEADADHGTTCPYCGGTTGGDGGGDGGGGGGACDGDDDDEGGDGGDGDGEDCDG